MSMSTNNHAGLPEETRPCRKFGVSDGMAIIVGVAFIAGGGTRIVTNLGGRLAALCRTIVRYDSTLSGARLEL